MQLNPPGSYRQNYRGPRASLLSYGRFAVTVLCVVALLCPLTAIFPLIVIATTTKGAHRKLLLTIAPLFSVTSWVAVVHVMGRTVALDPAGNFHGCRYVSDRPDLTDACAFDGSTSPLYYEQKIDRYLGAAGIAGKKAHHLRYAAVMDDDPNGPTLAIGCFQLDAANRKKLLAGMKPVAGRFDKAIATIKVNNPPLRDWLGYSPYKSLSWWPPPQQSRARILSYQRPVPASIDVETGLNYCVFTDDSTGTIWLLGW